MTRRGLDDDFEDTTAAGRVDELEAALDAMFAPVERAERAAAEIWPLVRQLAAGGDIDGLRALLAGHDAATVSRWMTTAVAEGDRDAFAATLAAGFAPHAWADPDNDDGDTLLMRAAAAGRSGMAEDLLAVGADAAAANLEGRTALHFAAAAGHAETARLLLDRGASAAAGGYPPQIDAAEAGDADLFRLLHDASGVDAGHEMWPDVADAEAALPELAARRARNTARRPSDDPATVEFLEAALTDKLPRAVRHLRRGADIDGYDRSGAAALHTAALAQKADFVAVLLREGADVNRRDWDENTPLHAACHAGAADVAGLLIDAGADLDAENDDGERAVTIAAGRGHVEILEALLEAGADPGEEEAWKLRTAAAEVADEEAERWTEFGGAAEPAPSEVPPTVTLKPPKADGLHWLDPAEVDEAAARLADAGFAPAGEFRVTELRRRVAAFVNREQSLHAAVNEQEPFGVWCEVIAEFEEGGTLTVTNGRHGESDVGGHGRHVAAEAEADELARLAAAGARPRRLGDFAALVEGIHRDRAAAGRGGRG